MEVETGYEHSINYKLKIIMHVSNYQANLFLEIVEFQEEKILVTLNLTEILKVNKSRLQNIEKKRVFNNKRKYGKQKDFLWLIISEYL